MQMRTESWNAEMKLSLCTSKYSELYEKISIYTLGEFVFLVYKGNLKGWAERVVFSWMTLPKTWLFVIETFPTSC